MPVKRWEAPSTQSTHPKRHPVGTSTRKPVLIVSRPLCCLSIKVNKPCRPLTREGLEVTAAFWKQSAMKKSGMGINWACSCLLHTAHVTKSTLLHGMFCVQGMSRQKWHKNPTRTESLFCSSMATLLPCRQPYLLQDLACEHFDAFHARIWHFCLLQWEVFSFSEVILCQWRKRRTTACVWNTQWFIWFHLLTPLSANGNKKGHSRFD